MLPQRLQPRGAGHLVMHSLPERLLLIQQLQVPDVLLHPAATQSCHQTPSSDRASLCCLAAAHEAPGGGGCRTPTSERVCAAAWAGFGATKLQASITRDGEQRLYRARIDSGIQSTRWAFSRNTHGWCGRSQLFISDMLNSTTDKRGCQAQQFDVEALHVEAEPGRAFLHQLCDKDLGVLDTDTIQAEASLQKRFLQHVHGHPCKRLRAPVHLGDLRCNQLSELL
mmetsp:Transcript_24296/g.61431  ORF Transcript_24296/g.61431 Transcript_24296/m.61431 type:complete len:225 (+) Transcript_24296:1083-1757(+)